MKIDDLRGRLPETAKDLRLNLSSVLKSEHLSPLQLYGTLVSCALAARNGDLLVAAEGEAAAHLSAEEIARAKAVGTTMVQNNVYYRFAHLADSEQFLQMPARLRMQALQGPESEIDRELWAIAVSAVTGCGLCITSHEKKLLAAGATREQIQDAVRVAAVVTATAAALDAEAAVASEA